MICMPLEVFSDNNPSNVTKFRRFAEEYDLKLTTSSPHYSLFNGQGSWACHLHKSCSIVTLAVLCQQLPPC
jgi:hypothetical protein